MLTVRPSRVAASLFALACLGPLSIEKAAAATLEQAFFQEDLFATNLFHSVGVDVNLPERFDGTNDVGYAAAAGFVQTTGGTLPRAEGAMTFSATGIPSTSLFAEFHARVYYEWAVEQVSGDPFEGPVPIDVHTRGAIDHTSTYGGKVQNLFAQAKIELPGTGLSSEYHLARGCVSFICSPGAVSFDDTFTGLASPGSVYRVTLTALGNGYLDYDKSMFTISAWVDPRIEISPAFDRRSDFRLVFSAGVTPVPEPATGWLAVAGLLALFWSMRVRNAKERLPFDTGLKRAM